MGSRWVEAHWVEVNWMETHWVEAERSDAKVLIRQQSNQHLASKCVQRFIGHVIHQPSTLSASFDVAAKLKQRRRRNKRRRRKTDFVKLRQELKDEEQKTWHV